MAGGLGLGRISQMALRGHDDHFANSSQLPSSFTGWGGVQYYATEILLGTHHLPLVREKKNLSTHTVTQSLAQTSVIIILVRYHK